MSAKKTTHPWRAFMPGHLKDGNGQQKPDGAPPKQWRAK